MNKLVVLLMLLPFLCSSAFATIIIDDDFETDSSGDYFIRDDNSLTELSPATGPDGTVTFAYDYVAAGIPQAPNSTGGTVGGLRITANDTSAGDSTRQEDHYSVFANTAVGVLAYTLQVDMYMEVDPNEAGTTEMASIGIGSDGISANSIFTPIAGDGHFVSITGDGGSSSDYRHFVEGTPVNSGDPSYLNSTNTTNGTGDTYQALFPGGDFPGSPGNRWTTVKISVNPSFVTYKLDGTPIIRTSTQSNTGFVSLGLADLFDSVGPHSVIFDNFVVTIPEPGTMLLASMGFGFLLVRRKK